MIYENIILAIITAIVTVSGSAFAFRQQRNKDALSTDQLKADLEKTLWAKLKLELEKETSRRKELEKRVQHLEGLVDELEASKSQLKSELARVRNRAETQQVTIEGLESQLIRLNALLESYREVYTEMAGAYADFGKEPPPRPEVMK